ncbi:hypothetical protein K470DRAFT_222426 [Piedraia hortae CBS 480.64]|uniref:Emopamil-binding protein n=1 Tax=Piedraia hortae CBS 480.64 TaxID=1314780 RepID=A0A6A7BT49_9PEZI|nr:hypothetical protein K470DRAFT_222426 [Piedraia hortae CBS 480.64]
MVTTRRIPASSTSSTTTKQRWTHTLQTPILLWLCLSLPLVAWDTGYILFRPLSMPGGSLHFLWKPYALYGKIDHLYGIKAWEAHNGWTTTQGCFNACETGAYLWYLFLMYSYGRAGDGKCVDGKKERDGTITVEGKVAAVAVLLGYSTSFMTFFKTVVYWGIEILSGFDNIGHNDFFRLVFLWIVPNGAWLVFPAYMMYTFGKEILQGLEAATKMDKYR